MQQKFVTIAGTRTRFKSLEGSHNTHIRRSYAIFGWAVSVSDHRLGSTAPNLCIYSLNVLVLVLIHHLGPPAPSLSIRIEQKWIVRHRGQVEETGKNLIILGLDRSESIAEKLQGALAHHVPHAMLPPLQGELRIPHLSCSGTIRGCVVCGCLALLALLRCPPFNFLFASLRLPSRSLVPPTPPLLNHVPCACLAYPASSSAPRDPNILPSIPCTHTYTYIYTHTQHTYSLSLSSPSLPSLSLCLSAAFSPSLLPSLPLCDAP